MSSPTSYYFRSTIQDTGTFSSTLQQYAKQDTTLALRLCITRRYSAEDSVPNNNYTLVSNSPLLLAVAQVRLPTLDEILTIVFDYPGLTMQRDVRADEVTDLVSKLTLLPPGKIYYGLQPIEATSELSVEEAVKVLLSCDFTALTPETEQDFLNRLR
ncbi:hypothetical protein [Chromobacterium haemolyticum]|uniref:hypothetical protein n=1 Tax=Chromobacterium haemolyticum TaxID=394935 RepID=UPI00244C67F1|nr:hypothetical protein [Chromobacterium haemolyticum]MDH0342063.1 hypothetical protein [Chromobacterium haemolyticum]